MLGNYSPESSEFLSLASRNLEGLLRADQLLVRPETRLNHDYNSLFSLQGRFERLSEHRFLYRLQQTIDGTAPEYNSPTPRDRKDQVPATLQKLEMGLGVLYYGGTLQYRLDELNPISRLIFQWDSDPTIRIGATALMPAELPLRGRGSGLLELNPWIGRIAAEDVSSSTDYPDLIEP